jgi:peptidoglycan/xylan/chitin deacetylase (PgdA/CDA1 family)
VATGQASTVIDRADPSRPGRVALTFDAGWIYEPVPDLLQALREHDVCATFFLRGGFVKDHPDLVQQIAAAGHLIANHSYTHGHMTTQTQAEQIDELERTNQLILDLTGQRPYLFRPPYGEYNGDLLRTAAACGFPYTVMWTVDSLDWMEPGVDEIYERVSTRLVDGAIVLMHVGSTQTPEVLPRLINLIREQGYELGTIPDMLPEEVFTGRQTYIVQAGDTLASIARKYGTEVEKLIEINNL